MTNLSPSIRVTLLLALTVIARGQCPPNNYVPATSTSVDASGNVIVTTKLTCPSVDPPPPPPPPATTPVTKLFNPAQYNHANTRYVSEAGNDSNDGNTLSTAWRNICKAVQSSPADTLIRVQPGNYSGCSSFSGKGNLSIVGDTQSFAGRPYVGGGGFVFDIRNANYCTFDNLKISSVSGGNSPIFIGGSGTDKDHHITVRNCEILGSATSTNGIHVYGGDIGSGGSVDYLTFEDNVIHAIPGHLLGWNVNVGPSGISIFKARQLDSNAGAHIIVRRNFIYDVAQNAPSTGLGISTITDGNGIIADLFNTTGYKARVDIYDNIISYVGGDGIDIYQSSNPVYIYNNTIYRSGRCRGRASCDGYGNGSGINANYAQNLYLWNNILFGRGGNGTNKGIARWGTGSISYADYNLIWDTSGNDSPGLHDKRMDPQLTAPAYNSVSSADWVPKTGSPAIGSGTAGYQTITADIDYWGRSYWTPHMGSQAAQAPAILPVAPKSTKFHGAKRTLKPKGK